MLAVVEHDEHAGGAERPRCRVDGSFPGDGLSAQGDDERFTHRAWVAHRGQVDETDAVAEWPARRSRDSHGEACLADACRAPERHEPMGTEPTLDLPDQLIPADQLGLVGRQIVDPAIVRPKWREVGAQLVRDDGVHGDRLVEPADQVATEVDELGSPTQAAGALGRRVAGEQDLTAVPRRLQPRGQVRRSSDDVAVGQFARAGVETDPHVQLADPRPGARCHKPLDLDRRFDGRDSVGENGEDAIARRLDHRSAMTADGRADQLVVLGDDDLHLVGMALPQPRAVLDVGEQDRCECTHAGC